MPGDQCGDDALLGQFGAVHPPPGEIPDEAPLVSDLLEPAHALCPTLKLLPFPEQLLHGVAGEHVAGGVAEGDLPGRIRYGCDLVVEVDPVDGEDTSLDPDPEVSTGRRESVLG